MTQPPGGAPPPYGLPPYGLPPYGAPGHGPPGYTPPPPPPPPPPRGGLPAWLVIGAALVLAGLAVLVVVLLARGGAGGSPTAVSSGPAASPAPSAPAPAPDDPRYPGSEDTARAWVDAMEQGAFQAAFDLSCAQVQAAATVSASEGEDPASALGTYFFDQVLGGVGFAGHTFEGITHDAASDTDLATFSLSMDDGTSRLLRVHVVQNGTVCDFR